MGTKRLFQYFILFGIIAIIFKALSFTQNNPKLITQNVNEYFGPNIKIPGNSSLIRVQVLVHDNPNPEGNKVLKVEFNRTNIPLKPSDVWGFRGQGSFQVPPQKYKIKWSVKKDTFAWPRSISHEKTIPIDKNDTWIQIVIEGNEISVIAV